MFFNNHHHHQQHHHHHNNGYNHSLGISSLVTTMLTGRRYGSSYHTQGFGYGPRPAQFGGFSHHGHHGHHGHHHHHQGPGYHSYGPQHGPQHGHRHGHHW